MSQQLELADFEKSSEHLPLFGMIVDGRVYLPQKLEPRTLDEDGSYLPTPTANEYGTSNNGNPGDSRTEYATKGKMSLSTMARRNVWATPTAMEGGVSHGPKKQGGEKLTTQVGGKLNPQWVEWLMNYPTGWTELSVWAMLWSPDRSRKRSKG